MLVESISAAKVIQIDPDDDDDTEPIDAASTGVDDADLGGTSLSRLPPPEVALATHAFDRAGQRANLHEIA